MPGAILTPMTSYAETKAKFTALNEELRGVLMMFAASFFFSLMGFFIKLLSAHHNTFEIVFFRNIVSFAVIGLSMYFIRPSSIGGKPFLLVLRGIFGFLAMFCFFYTVSVLPLATASTFVKTSPIFTAILAGFLLKEKTGGRVWTAVLLGFAGVVIILKPSHAIAPTGALTGLSAGLIAAMAYTSIKGLAKYYDARTIVMAFSTAGLVGSSVFFIYRFAVADPRYTSWEFVPAGADIAYVLMVGILASVAQWLMSVAYKYGRASVISTISYVGLIFSTVFGYIAGDGWPGALSLLGIFMIGISGIMVGMAKK